MADPSKVFEKEAKLFESKKAELLKHHAGKFVAIYGDKILGIFDSDDAALKAAFESIGPEPVFIHRIDNAPADFSSPALTLGLLMASP
jgi:hypothetical protein